MNKKFVYQVGNSNKVLLKMKVLWCFKTSVTIWKSTWRSILRRLES